MRIVAADFIFTCNDNFEIIIDGAICFDEQIVDIGKKSDIIKKYKNIKAEQAPKNSVLMPGLINNHTHLEFSKNVATLSYGDYITWLNSVIKNREKIQESCSDNLVKNTLASMLKSGTTTIGNISSYGEDFLACKNTKQKIIYFVEAIGSTPSALDALYSHTQARLYEALEYKTKTFIPALSVHSLYSTNPFLAKKVINLAKKENLLVSTHFMESIAERNWIDKKEEDFKGFFNNFNPNIKPMYENTNEYIELFKDVKSLFTHCVYASQEELAEISKLDSAITHCPVSNVLLGSKKLKIDEVLKNKICLTLGTDGLSSNISLNLWDEMRASFMMHNDKNIGEFAKLLLLSVTKNSAKALNLNTGELKKGLDADIIITTLKEIPENLSQLPLQLILQTKEVSNIYINGEEIR